MLGSRGKDNWVKIDKIDTVNRKLNFQTEYSNIIIS